METIFILIFIWHFTFFAEGSCDNFKTDVVLLIAPMIIMKYFRKNVFKNKLTRVYQILIVPCPTLSDNWAPSSEFVSSSILSWQILTAHAQPFRGARDLAFCLKVPLDSLLVWASSEGSGETARMRRLAWTFAARIGDKYQIRLTRSIYINLHPYAFHQFVLKILSGNEVGITGYLKLVYPYIACGGIIRQKRPTAEIALLAR